MPENYKTGAEEKKIRIHYIHVDQKDGRKKCEKFQETPVECRNGSEALFCYMT